MGYEMHIHRATDSWLDSAAAPISEPEWLALAEADPELVREGGYLTARSDGSTAEVPVFTFKPPGSPEGASFSLDPTEGRVTVAGAYDEASRVKAVAVADLLGARAQGDDDEWYGPDGEPIVEHNVEPPKRGFLDRFRRR